MLAEGRPNLAQEDSIVGRGNFVLTGEPDGIQSQTGTIQNKRRIEG